MKKAIPLLLCVLFLLTGCKQNENTAQDTVRFYYCKNSETFSVGESYIISEERAITENDLTELLGIYLKGPESTEYRTPFTNSLSVISCETVEDTVFLTLSNPIARLTGSKLTVACACISLTVLDYTQAETVVIRAQDALLDGNETITMSRDQLIIFDADSQKQIPRD